MSMATPRTNVNVRHGLCYATCIGDFHKILTFDEKNDRLSKPLGMMQAFQITLLHCGLMDLGHQGNIFTWRNGWVANDFVKEMLECACATLEWSELFPSAKVRHLSVTYSDHDSIALKIEITTPWQVRRKKIQRFEEKWVAHADYKNLIRTSWELVIFTSSLKYCLFEKIKKCHFNLVN